jgi:hypothetical protein
LVERHCSINEAKVIIDNAIKTLSLEKSHTITHKEEKIERRTFLQEDVSASKEKNKFCGIGFGIGVASVS